ncbi:MAG TPA: PEP-CTERM sorting domain-containing protein, partial [Tepidisphaeraceae bacterium]|nr:PEP-CTERM sorting domain-containing protein [Tepidisphaeraceae bacterium]
SSFDYSSASGSVRYKAGVHVQGLTDGGSGWVAPAVAAVPEPGTTAFVALAAGLVAARRRR